MSLLCTAALGYDVTPLVRLASKEGFDIATLLDCGAQGLMVPHIESADNARSVVRKCKYPPVGSRSVTTACPHLSYGSYPEDEIIAHMNREALLVGMLETPAAVDKVGEIAAVPGIDVVHIGARDMCTEFGTPGEYRSRRMLEIYEQTAAAARRYRKAAGVGGVRGDTAFQVELYRMGFRYMTIGSDVGYMLAGGKADVSALTDAVAAR